MGGDTPCLSKLNDLDSVLDRRCGAFLSEWRLLVAVRLPCGLRSIPSAGAATAQLQNLANLHTQGVLTDEEFAAAKAKILGI